MNFLKVHALFNKPMSKNTPIELSGLYITLMEGQKTFLFHPISYLVLGPVLKNHQWMFGND